MNKENRTNNQVNKYELIIPVAASDFHILKDSIYIIKEKLEPKFITIISSKDVVNAFNEVYGGNPEIKLLDEDSVYEGMSLARVKDCMKKRNADKKAGWLYQQFLKYAYSYVAQSEYYVAWDADTIPLQNIDYFENNKPIFFLKEEYYEPYFNTMERLIGCKKVNQKSFIAENMIFKTDFVKEIIKTIEDAGADEWYINIINAISDKDMHNIVPGFSEFETYGTFVSTRHPGYYEEKNIRAIRRLKQIMKDIPDKNVLDWLGKSFFSASFEKWDATLFNASLCKYKLFRAMIHPRLFVKINFMIVNYYKRKGKTKEING